MRIRYLFAAGLLLPAALSAQQDLNLNQREAREIFRELIEINTAYKAGSTTPAAHAIVRGLEGAIGARRVTYDLARQMPGATEVSTSAFADAIIEHLS